MMLDLDKHYDIDWPIGLLLAETQYVRPVACFVQHAIFLSQLGLMDAHLALDADTVGASHVRCAGSQRDDTHVRH